jgi:GTP-binding protein EngB required for normal cell division
MAPTETGAALFSMNSKITPADPAQEALDLAAGIADRYDLRSLRPLMHVCGEALNCKDISIAVAGRFKAGKSSFLNHLLRRSLLPVGVVPVTAVVTEIRFGRVEKVRVHFENGTERDVPVTEVAGFVSEQENPGNRKGASLIQVELPTLAELDGLVLVDTPGLESALEHNTESAMQWLPNAGMVLVAISVDPPLSQRDLDLLKLIYRYTPNVSILLTKVDLITSDERAEVTEFITTQLRKTFGQPPAILPYSVRPGFERLREQLEHNVLRSTLSTFSGTRMAIASRKVETLLDECSDFLTLNLRAAESLDSVRASWKEQALGEKEALSDVKSQLGLIVQHATGGTREFAAGVFERHERDIRTRLLADFEAKFPRWPRTVASMMDAFEEWLNASLSRELSRISSQEKPQIIESRIQVTKRQVMRSLQDFRNRLADNTQRAFGVPLRTTEVEISVQEPASPDIRIGRIFDRSWDLLSPILPVPLIRGLIRRHFEKKIEDRVYTNISRLASQWQESVHAALRELERDAQCRLDDLLATVERLMERADNNRAAEIRDHLERIAVARKNLEERAQ